MIERAALISFPSSEEAVRLIVCCFMETRSLSTIAESYLSEVHIDLLQPQTQADLFDFLDLQSQSVDCLILQESPALFEIISWLHRHAILLPTVIVNTGNATMVAPTAILPLPGPKVQLLNLYHTAEVRLAFTDFRELETAVERAIAQFLYLSPACGIPTLAEPDLITELTTQNFILLQQRRLSDKLKERLGYMGVYYKRHPSSFLRNLSRRDREEVLADLKSGYHSIILGYFSEDSEINQKIDRYVDAAFFADISVSQAVEIHMEIMDDFAKQLKLEGRHEEVVLDYRLTLIDTLAHLCEMYRRSIPKDTSNVTPDF